ncbi:MAG TPA: hypothetical protein DCP62_00090 [Erysipelotrichaceae bacterium]|nr:hypothetical protein [Erysipelotrichaceae bacterium]
MPTLRELLKKPFWKAGDLAQALGINERTAQRKMAEIRAQLKKEGFINVHHSMAPTSVVISKLKIDVEWYEKNGLLDEELEATDVHRVSGSKPLVRSQKVRC